jgi:hypothetical protein
MVSASNPQGRNLYFLERHAILYRQPTSLHTLLPFELSQREQCVLAANLCLVTFADNICQDERFRDAMPRYAANQ